MNPLKLEPTKNGFISSMPTLRWQKYLATNPAIGTSVYVLADCPSLMCALPVIQVLKAISPPPTSWWNLLTCLDDFVPILVENAIILA
jgi:hypothetical protein